MILIWDIVRKPNNGVFRDFKCLRQWYNISMHMFTGDCYLIIPADLKIFNMRCAYTIELYSKG